VSEHADAFQALLAKMREDFVHEIPDRCYAFEEKILQLEKSPGDVETFDALYRGVHSLKGAGGTHGLGIITSICHQFENLLTEAGTGNDFGQDFTTQAFAYIDLIRQVAKMQQAMLTDFEVIEKKLESLRRSVLNNRKSVLVVESSRLMMGLYREALESLPVQLSFMDNGLAALGRILHEPFDLVIVGRELKELGGVAMIAALRFSQGGQREIPAILVSSKGGGAPEQVDFSANILRDQNLAANLLAAVKKILHV
jgi:CheY-like chemotaxis protein